MAHSSRIQKLPKELLIDIIIDLSDALNKISTNSISSNNNLTISSNFSNNPSGLTNLQQTYQQFLYNNSYLNDDLIMSQK